MELLPEELMSVDLNAGDENSSSLCPVCHYLSARPPDSHEVLIRDLKHNGGSSDCACCSTLLRICRYFRLSFGTTKTLNSEAKISVESHIRDEERYALDLQLTHPLYATIRLSIAPGASVICIYFECLLKLADAQIHTSYLSL